MGCDIHIYVEKKNNNQWEAMARPEDWKYGFDKFRNWFWYERNYDLFAILADVRNPGDLEPIALPRGLPDDVSDLVSRAAPGTIETPHSHSWFSLQELLSWDWDKPAGEKRGYVLIEDAEAYRRSGIIPTSYAAATSEKEWTHMAWKVTYRDCAPDFPDALVKLSALANPVELRIVFWFDN